jgi:hypothetical protein
LREPAGLVALELEEVVDEHVPELGTEQRLERVERGRQLAGSRGRSAL